MKRRFAIVQLQIGKNGLTDEFIAQVKRIFETEQIVKISILKSACRDKTEAKELCDKLNDALGKKFTYRLVGYVATFHKFRRDVKE